MSGADPGFTMAALTGVVSSDEMRRHAPLFGDHPECPDRITRINDLLAERGILQKMLPIAPRPATDAEIVAAHTVEHKDYIATLATMDTETIRCESNKWDSVYLNQETEISARFAAGSLCAATEAVCTGTVRNAVAVIRPPGHHAEHHCCMGFCIYNNVAVATRFAQQRFNARRVLIVDWDVHHGNGTQNIFVNDPSVLFFSVHRWSNGKFYPPGNAGAPTSVGEGVGAGYSVNIGWNQRRMGDAEYLLAFSQVLMPIATEFDPDLVFISAGFDAARGDPLGGCNVTPEGYARLTHMVSGLAEGRVIVALEGGYNLTSISESMVSCASTLVGNPVPRFEEPLEKCSDDAKNDIAETIDALRPYWNLLVPMKRPREEREEREKAEEAEEAAMSQDKEGGLDNRLCNMSLAEDDLRGLLVSDGGLLSPPVTRGGTRRHLPPKPAPLNLTGLTGGPTGKQRGAPTRNKAVTPAEIPAQAMLNAAYAAALACRWYKMYSPFASHFAMVPVAAVENSETQWTVRYKVEPDTGLEYDRQFTFVPADPARVERGWRCTSMSSWDPDLPEIVQFDEVGDDTAMLPSSPARPSQGQLDATDMADWLPTTPFGIPSIPSLPKSFTPIVFPM